MKDLAWDDCLNWDEAYAEKLQEEERAYVAAGGEKNGMDSPMERAYNRSQVRFIHKHVYEELGEPFSVLTAIYYCAYYDWDMPEWLRKAFMERYDLLAQYKVKSTDEAFGTYLAKNAKLPAHRQWYEKSIAATTAVIERHERGEPIGPALFESVGESLNISGSKVSDYYYEWKDAL